MHAVLLRSKPEEIPEQHTELNTTYLDSFSSGPQSQREQEVCSAFPFRTSKTTVVVNNHQPRGAKVKVSKATPGPLPPK